MPDRQTAIDELKDASAAKAKDPTTRRILFVIVILWCITLLALVGITWQAYFSEKAKTRSLAAQVALACESGDFGNDFSDEDQAVLCSNADKVIENKGEIQDEEVQESEVQEPEIQNSEVQDAERDDPELQNPERQDPELQDEEIQDPESNDTETQDEETQDEEVQDDEKQEDEIQDPEIQDEEIQNEENQDPEIDDPDPASPYNFTFVYTIPGNGLGQPARTYSVTCNSGTGECTVTEV